MRRNIFVAVGLALSLAGTAAAQQGEKAQRQERGHGDHREMAGQHGRRGPDGLLLKGIALTEGQRAQIAQLRQAQRQSFEAARKAQKAERKEMRAARERGDTAAVRATRQKNRQAMEQARTQRIAAIRNILTAEQRVQFDKNVIELESRSASRGERGKRKRG